MSNIEFSQRCQARKMIHQDFFSALKILRYFWVADSENAKLLGQWDIYIFFDENTTVDRTSSLTFKDSYEGLYIIGENLTDNCGKVTVERWFTQEAEIYHYDNKIILVYHYWLQDDADKDTYSKLGIETAISDDGGKSFQGTFKDIILENGAIERQGTVRLNKKLCKDSEK